MGKISFGDMNMAARLYLRVMICLMMYLVRFSSVKVVNRGKCIVEVHVKREFREIRREYQCYTHEVRQGIVNAFFQKRGFIFSEKGMSYWV